MQGWIARVRERGLTGTARLASDSAGLLVALSVLAFCVVADIRARQRVGGDRRHLRGRAVRRRAARRARCHRAGRRCSPSAAAAASPSWNMNTETAEQVVRLGDHRSGQRLRRRRFLAADADLRALGAPAAARLGRRGRRRVAAARRDAAPGDRGDRARASATSAWSTRSTTAECRGSRPAPTVATTPPRSRSACATARPTCRAGWSTSSAPGATSRAGGRGSATRSCAGWPSSPEDLEFLRSLGLRSSIVVPIRARDRNLGALTLLSAWSERRYSADDVHFAQILASRIGLALDNAGLFSDLESVERRMDTVMSILDEAVVIHDADGELVFANPAAARRLGYETSEEAIATPTRDQRALRDPRRGGRGGRRRCSGRARGAARRPRSSR